MGRNFGCCRARARGLLFVRDPEGQVSLRISTLSTTRFALADNNVSRQHLKAALTLASNSQDNHLRASILALIASQYFYTARDHCMSTLQTCEQLAAGLGAPLKGENTKVVPGNAHLALWVGKHFLGLCHTCLTIYTMFNTLSSLL